MNDVKMTVAKNITELRILNQLTQAQLAEQLNYSDKAVSKWERGESSPDISVLVEIADLFGVSLDYLVREENIDDKVKTNKTAETRYNRRAITYIVQGLVWFIALFAFILTSLITEKATFQWLYFIYAMPVASIVWLIFNSIWFNPRHNYFIISVLMWATLTAIYATFLFFKINVGLIFLLGVAGEIIILLWSFIKKPVKK